MHLGKLFMWLNIFCAVLMLTILNPVCIVNAIVAWQMWEVIYG